MSTLRISDFGKYRIAITSELVRACDAEFSANDFCPLCDCHPSAGHRGDCPLVVECESVGHVRVAEAETES